MRPTPTPAVIGLAAAARSARTRIEGRATDRPRAKATMRIDHAHSTPRACAMARNYARASRISEAWRWSLRAFPTLRELRGDLLGGTRRERHDRDLRIDAECGRH